MDSRTAYYFGDDKTKLGEYAWFLDNSDYRYYKDGTKANPWGLYNIPGNVAEWIMDQYEEDYSKFADHTAEDPWAEPLELHPRTVRGGSWNHEKEKLRCASRIASDPQCWNRNDPQIPKSLWWNTNSPFVGFRLVQPVDPPLKEEQEKFWKETLDQFYYE